MKRVSGTGKPITGVVIVLEPVEVQVPALAVKVEVSDVAVAVRVLPDQMCKIPSIPLLLEYSQSCILFGALKPAGILHQVASFFRDLK